MTLFRYGYPYFVVVAVGGGGVAWSHDTVGYAGGRVAIGRVHHAGQNKGDDPHKKGYPGPPGWG
jgi:hypothetical protein